MPEEPDPPVRDAEHVVEIFLAWLEESEHGAGPSFEALRARHPGVAARLSALHAAHERARSLLDPGPMAPDPREHPAPDGALPAAERYEILGELARGGMGSILEVYDPALRRTIAMKTVRPDRIREASSRAEIERQQSRLLAEAQILAQLDHPGVVAIHAVGRDERGRAYFTMKRVQGRDFAQVISLYRAGATEWPLARAVRVLVRVCEAVAYAHEKGVVHRDLKPANVMVGRFGEVFVMDWGLAKVTGRPETALPLEPSLPVEPSRAPNAASPETEVIQTDRESGPRSGPGSPLATEQGFIVGTPGYLAPEQARAESAAIGPRTDVYALGAMLYHLLSGRHPYARERQLASSELVSFLLAGPPEPLVRLAPHAPEELVAIAEKAMERDPAARYASALELGEELNAWLEGRVVRAHRTGAWVELRKWVRRNRGAAAAILAVVLGLGALALVETLLRRDIARAQRETAQRAEELRREDAQNRVALASAALSSGEISHLRELLDGCPADLRGWEWRHLWRESDTSERKLELSDLELKSVLLLAGGEQLLCAGTAQPPRIQVVDLASGTVTRELVLETDESINNASLSADGGWLAVFARLGALRLWDTRTWEPLPSLDAELHGWHGAAFAPAGLLLAAYGTEGVQLWDAAERANLGLLRVDAQRDIADVAWSPDGARLFAASWDGSIGVWDVAARALVTVLRESGERMQQVACSPDGRWLAGGNWESRLLVWDARTLALVHRSDRIGGQVMALAWSPDSHRIAVAGGSIVRLFAADSWERVGRLVGHKGRVNTLQFSADGRRVVSGCSLGRVRLWDLERGDWRTLYCEDGREPPAGVAFAPDGERAAVGWGPGEVEIWNTRTRTRERVLHTGTRIRHLDWSRNGARLALADWERDILLFDPADGRQLGRLEQPAPTEVHFDPSGSQLAATANDGSLRAWSLGDGSLAWTAPMPSQTHGWPGDLFGASWSPDGRELVACNFDGRIQVRSAASGALLRETLRPGMLFVQFSPDGSRILASAYAGNQGMEMLAARDLAPLWTSKQTSHLWPVLSPSGERVFSANWLGFLGVWDASTGRLVAEIEGLPPGNPRLGVSPDGACVVLAAGKHLALFDSRREP